MHIAIVEDEKKLAYTLEEGLEAEGYDVDLFYDGLSAEAGLASDPSYALAILDLMLPRKNGFDVCRDLRARGSTLPILVLTARDSVEDKVRALDSGADDFLTKPFMFEELMARMRAITRRSQGAVAERLTSGDLVVDTALRRVTRAGNEVALTPTEFDLLCLLLRKDGRPAAREEISLQLWNQGDASFSNVVDVHISNLRRKIDDEYTQKLVRTVRGVGYAIQK